MKKQTVAPPFHLSLRQLLTTSFAPFGSEAINQRSEVINRVSGPVWHRSHPINHVSGPVWRRSVAINHHSGRINRCPNFILNSSHPINHQLQLINHRFDRTEPLPAALIRHSQHAGCNHNPNIQNQLN